MAAVLLGRWEPGSDEWLAARQAGLGGSEIAAVLGLSPFESRFSLWHRKAGQIGDVEQTPQMEWGTRLEPAILGKFLDEHPELRLVIGGTYRHPDRPWQIANPDGLLIPWCGHADDDLCEPGCSVEPAALVETKFSLFGDGWGQAGTDQVPPHVRCQVLWYLDVFDLDTGHVAVLIGGHDYREYVIHRDEAECAELRRAAAVFLHELEHRVRPDIDSHTATYETVRELHPDIDPDEVVLNNDTARAYLDAKAAEKAAKDAAQEATSRVADEMGNAQRATWDGRTLARRQARNGGLPYIVAARGLTDTAGATT